MSEIGQTPLSYVMAASEAEMTRLRKIEAAARVMLDAIEEKDSGGYVYDASVAECVECDATAPTMAEVQHDEDCFQRKYEMLRDALRDCPCQHWMKKKVNAEWTCRIHGEMRMGGK